MKTSGPFARRAALLAGALLVLAAFAGCKHGYSAEDGSSGDTGAAGELLAPRPGIAGLGRSRSLYPLAVGNRWDYRVRVRNEITTDAGPQPPEITEGPFSTEIVGTETVGDFEYFQEAEFVAPEPPSGAPLFRLRSSRFGLFELDAVRTQQQVRVDPSPTDPVAASLAAYVDRTIVDPARRAAFRRAAAEVDAKLAALRPRFAGQGPRPQASAAPGEITLLRYPVYAGARWLVRDDPRFARIVVGRDRIEVPLGTFAAWKLRGTSELYGPEDRVHFWYSNLGLLRFRYHVVGNATDDSGNIIGRVITDSDQSLTGIHLVRGSAALATGNVHED